jgi:hypothetical protein
MTQPAPIGHNNPPDPIDTITAAFEDARAEAESWLDGKAVETEGQMKAVDELRGSMRQWRIGLEKGQKDATAPLHDAWKREGERWKPTIADAKMIEDGLVAIVDVFKRKLAAEKEAARKKAEAEAWEKTRAAQEAARLADAGNIEATRAAAAAIAEAENAQKLAQNAAKDTVKGLRTVTRYEVTDHRALLHWIAKNDRDAITSFVDEYARKEHKVIANAEGIRVWQDKEAY